MGFAIPPPATTETPFTDTAPEQLFHADMFHVFKLGVGRHYVASTLVAQFGYVPCRTSNTEDLLAAAYADFLQGCSELKQAPSVKAFTRDILHFSKHMSFPWGGWKGADTLMLCRWLLLLFRKGLYSENGSCRLTPLLVHPFEASHEPLLPLV